MKVSVQNVGLTAKQPLLDLLQEKLDSLERFSDRIQEAKVTLKVDKADDRQNKIMEVRLVIPGNDLFVKKHGATFEELVPKVVDTLHREIVDWKERQR
ncbi:MAG: HPF/RaiA family ribosome-associated protein [Bacteroidota bacterium]|jgi:putative sigma-54 modulation protein|nr:ribosome-associated translation inhibitor RaiA [Bacteroidota bacterium]MCA4898974.1 ribosome-associated translation inhibitor RaiA [Cytophagales bacterium]MCE2956362.1 HPF/RaiA family ribosome-associated protein [Flammeovirgaceae bacterium]MCZ8071238.1 HPF/RaiA family ribosome-associated protein [Cytophagales bacterium]